MGDESILSGRRGGRRASAGARSRGGSPRRGGGRTRCGSRRGTRRGRRRGPIPRTLCRRSGTIPQQCIAPGEGTKSRQRPGILHRAASIVARPPPGSSTGLNGPPRRRRGRRRPPRALRIQCEEEHLQRLPLLIKRLALTGILFERATQKQVTSRRETAELPLVLSVLRPLGLSVTLANIDRGGRGI